MKITYIIGNGFDLNIGLKTSYDDFYKYYSNQPTNSYLIKYIKDRLKKDIHVKDDSEGINWSDLEEALGALTSEFDKYNEHKFRLYETVFRDFYDKLIEYLKLEEQNLRDIKISDTNKLRNDLVYPDTYLRTADKQNLDPFINKFTNIQVTVDIINFNYTNSFKILLNNSLENKYPIGINRFGGPAYLNSINHIHRTLERGIIMGVNDPSQISSELFRKDRKMNNLLIKPQLNKIQKELIDEKCQNIIKSSDLICIYGSSFGKTDRKWWELIVEQLLRKDCRIIIFKWGAPVKYIDEYGDKEDEIRDLLLSHSNDDSIINDDKILSRILISDYPTKIFSSINNIIPTLENEAKSILDFVDHSNFYKRSLNTTS